MVPPCKVYVRKTAQSNPNTSLAVKTFPLSGDVWLCGKGWRVAFKLGTNVGWVVGLELNGKVKEKENLQNSCEITNLYQKRNYYGPTLYFLFKITSFYATSLYTFVTHVFLLTPTKKKSKNSFTFGSFSIIQFLTI